MRSITGALTRAAAKGPPPVELWNPPFCGDLDMRIAADGTWFYLKTPIGRPALVKLFASVLKREGDKYFSSRRSRSAASASTTRRFSPSSSRSRTAHAGRVLNFRTNVDDWVACGPEHPLRFEPEAGTGGLKPYLHVRRDLWAKVTRALFFDLVELGEERDIDGRAMFGVASMGAFFPMAPRRAGEGFCVNDRARIGSDERRDDFFDRARGAADARRAAGADRSDAQARAAISISIRSCGCAPA